MLQGQPRKPADAELLAPPASLESHGEDRLKFGPVLDQWVTVWPELAQHGLERLVQGPLAQVAQEQPASEMPEPVGLERTPAERVRKVLQAQMGKVLRAQVGQQLASSSAVVAL